MIDTVVVEDEIEIQDFIVSLLSRYCNEVRIVGRASSVKQARLLIEEKKPELVFMDVELEDGKAFEILETFDVNDFVTVFLTGYSKYGIDGIKYGASDYLLKPIILKDLMTSVEKAKQKVKEKHILRKFHSPNLYEEIEGKILVQKIDNKKVILSYSEILNWKCEQGYTRVYLINNQNHLLRGTLKSYIERLPSFFIKIHRSHSINLNFIQSYSLKRNGWVKLKSDLVLPVSSRNKGKFLKAVNTIM